jgi:hypothetical protein
MLHAERKGDWKTVAEHAGELADRQRWAESLQWNLGRAAFRLGDWELARQALGRFVRCCHDELEHPRAVELLAEVEAKSGTSRAAPDSSGAGASTGPRGATPD